MTTPPCKFKIGDLVNHVGGSRPLLYLVVDIYWKKTYAHNKKEWAFDLYSFESDKIITGNGKDGEYFFEAI